MQKTTSPHSPASKPYAHPPTPSSKPSSSTATIQTCAKIASTYSPPPKTSSPTTATFENSNPTALYSRGYARIAHLGNTGFFVALSRPLGSIRPLVAPISHSLNTALGLRLCARAGTLARIRLRSCAIAIRQYAQLLSPYLACCNQSLEIDDRITVLNYTNCIVLYCKSRQHRTYGHIVRSSINPSMCQLRSRRNACIHCPLGIFPYCNPHLHRTCYRIARSYWNPSKC